MITSAWKFGLNIEEIDIIRSANNDGWDNFDEKSIHLIIYNEGAPVGCGSIYSKPAEQNPSKPQKRNQARQQSRC